MTTMNLTRAGWLLKIGLPALCAVQLIFAQGMPGTPSQPGTMMMPGVTGMALGMNGMGMMTMGADGTFYIVRRLPQTTGGSTTPDPTTYKSQMVAVNSQDGSTKWTLEIPGVMMSKPALAPDGRLFLTSGSIAFDHQGIQGGMMGSQSNSNLSTGKLMVVTADGSSAQIAAQIDVDSHLMATPEFGQNADGSYTVYMTGFTISQATQQQGMGGSSMADGELDLYAFQPDGTLKYKTKLGDGQMGYGPGYPKP